MRSSEDFCEEFCSEKTVQGQMEAAAHFMSELTQDRKQLVEFLTDFVTPPLHSPTKIATVHKAREFLGLPRLGQTDTGD